MVRGKKCVDAHHTLTTLCSVLVLLLPQDTLVLHQGILRCYLRAQGMLMRASYCQRYAKRFRKESVECPAAHPATWLVIHPPSALQLGQLQAPYLLVSLGILTGTEDMILKSDRYFRFILLQFAASWRTVYLLPEKYSAFPNGSS